MTTLWANDDRQAWARALESYPATVAAREVSRLTDLDEWYREELPGAIAGRSPRRLPTMS